VNDHDLAVVLVSRLNELIRDEDVRADVCRLMNSRVKCSVTTAKHPTIQVQGLISGGERLGFLGLLNGVVGAGANKCGHIKANYTVTEKGLELVEFVVSEDECD
jgi:hypothetical protein